MIKHKRMASRVILIVLSVICAFALAVTLRCFAQDGNSINVAVAATAVNNERVLIAIEGMQCASCASGIKAMLKRTPGVVSAEVSFERREAAVEYDPSRTSPEKIVEAITKMGYKASVKE